MCNFFSVTSDGKGNIKYFDWAIREKILNGEIDYFMDSHTSINEYYGFCGLKEDIRNKYEFNPLTGKFRVDEIYAEDDSREVEKKVRALNFKEIMPQLIIKPIINPFKDVKRKQKEPNKHEISLFQKWIRTLHLTWFYNYNKVESCLLDSLSFSPFVGKKRKECEMFLRFITSSFADNVFDVIKRSIRKFILKDDCESIVEFFYKSSIDVNDDYVWELFERYFLDSFFSYASSFIDLKYWFIDRRKEKRNPFQPCIELWEAGLVPSFDSQKWRLHAGECADVVYEEIV